VADCKRATVENMAHVHQHGGRFLTVLPRTRSEDGVFRQSLSGGLVHWRGIYDKDDDQGNLVDRYSLAEPAMSSAQGYRLVWYHSTRKAQGDAAARLRQGERALEDLAEWEQKLGSPRSRYHHRAKVAEAVETMLAERGTTRWISTEIDERVHETYRQERRGRPSEKTRYVREVKTRFELKYAVDHAALAAERLGDGVFPLISNDRTLSDRELLLASKGQPVIEKHFSQLKTDFEVAPVYLKEVSRIQALLCMYFLTLWVESLLERERRRAMERRGVASLPLYPEGRACRYPTVPRLIEVFEGVQRHTLLVGTKPPVVFTTKLTRLQRQILSLLGMSRAYDG
jgi:transposase